MREKTNNIYIIGYMGSGKTTVGKTLSTLLHKDFVDMDQVIEQEQGQTINQIFMKYGEHSFRNYEGELLDKIANDTYQTKGSNGAVISCGGGIILDDENRKVLKSELVVWLDAEPGIMFERIKDSVNLPNAYMHISDEEERLGVFTKQYKQRQASYEEVTSIRIDITNKNPEETAKEIANKIEGMFEDN